jgi:hypothetical protein
MTDVHYIIGLGRSGSTLLTTILNGHSKIKAIPEIPIAIFFKKKFGSISKRNLELEKYSHEYLEIYQKIRPRHLINLHAEKLKVGIDNYNSYPNFLKIIYSNFEIIEKNGNFPLVLVKNPYFTFNYESLCNLSPDAKFIIMVRDYRANVLSRKKKILNKTGNIVFNAFLCRFFLKKINEIKTNKNCLVVRYEDLVTNQIKTLSDICNFLNIEFENELISTSLKSEISDNIENGKAKKFIKEHFKELRNPIHGKNIDKWRAELSSEEIAICDAICSKEAKSFDYLPTEKVQQKLRFLIMKHLIIFLKAMYNVKKERLLYYLPIKIKMKRLKQKINNQFEH